MCSSRGRNSIFLMHSVGVVVSVSLYVCDVPPAPFTCLQILCPHSSVMDPQYRDAPRSRCRTWGPPPTRWRPAGSLPCHETRASSVRRCRGLLTRWPAEKITACRRRRTCRAAWETCRTSTEALRSPSSQT